MDPVVDLAAALATVADPWSPRTVATLNDYDVRVVRTDGEFTSHRHPDTDELFLVLRGSLTIRLPDAEVHLGPGQLYVVPRGVQHQPVSADGAEVLLIEPSATVNTGDTPSELTAERHVLTPGPYATSLEALEASVRVPRDRQVSEQGDPPPPPPLPMEEIDRQRLLGITAAGRLRRG